MITKCFKIKSGKSTEIPNSKCEKKHIDKFLDKGFTITKVTEDGNKTKVESFSPRQRQPEGNWARELYKQGNVKPDWWWDEFGQ